MLLACHSIVEFGHGEHEVYIMLILNSRETFSVHNQVSGTQMSKIMALAFPVLLVYFLLIFFTD